MFRPHLQPEDSQERIGYENGFACAQRELETGHPGYFYRPSDGDYLASIERHTGLPVFCFGDSMTTGLLGWCRGFNASTSSYLHKHGLPWNSRLASMAAFTDLEGYFSKRLNQKKPFRMSMDSPAQEQPNQEVSLECGTDDALRPGQTILQLSSSRLYLGGFAGAYRMGRSTATEHHSSIVKSGSTTPCIGRGVKKVSLRFYSDAETIDFFWGPAGSELAFFRFGNCPSLFSREVKDYFAALDLQLGEWIPTFDRGGDVVTECHQIPPA